MIVVFHLDLSTAAQWDAEFKEQRPKQERLHRVIEERRARGDETGATLEAAMRDERIIDLPGEPPPSSKSTHAVLFSAERADQRTCVSATRQAQIS